MKKLYHFSLSPFCRKIRLVLGEKGVEAELIEEKFWERRLQFLNINHAGAVPVLVEKEIILSDSLAIFEYLEETYAEPSLLPDLPLKRAESRRLSNWFDDKFHKEVTQNLLYERVYKKITQSGYPNSEKIKLGIKNLRYHLDYMDWLLEKRKWLAGDEMTIADFAASAHLSSLDYINDVNWAGFPCVKEWYSKIKSRPAFRPILSDLLTGFNPPDHYGDLDF
ncbi:MAG: glutathione S-transferase family protein [Paracoccaceae bacterium]|nr:glutathione S-transferase family protein [Paracoccaceae bacterium]